MPHLHGRIPGAGRFHLLLARSLRRMLAEDARLEKTLPAMQHDHITNRFTKNLHVTPFIANSKQNDVDEKKTRI